MMSRSFAIAIGAVLALGAGVSAGQAAQPAQSPVSADVMEGRRLFAQKCAVCHVPATRGAEPYGPRLSKAQVNGAEEAVTQVIRNGGLRMPGFQYALEPRQIAAIVAFMKTLDAPPDRIVVDAVNP
jgi:mono/diheme cytochrome c family protein